MCINLFNASNYGLKKNLLKGNQSAARRCIYATFRAINARGSLTSLLKSPSIRTGAERRNRAIDDV